MNYEESADYFMNSFKSQRARHAQGAFPVLEMPLRGEFFALKLLSFKEGPMSAGELSDVMQISSARVATMLGRLEDKGLIERRIDPNDRRRIVVILTEKGRNDFITHHRLMRDNLISVFKKMGEKDTEECIRLFTLFSRLMSEQVKEGNS